MLQFLTPQQVGALTRGRYNPRFRAAVRLPNGHVLTAQTGERTPGQIRERHKILAHVGDNGYVFTTGA